MFENSSKIFLLSFVILFSTFFNSAVADTYLITRTSSGDVLKTDLTKPQEGLHSLFNPPDSDVFEIVKRSQWLEQDPADMPEKLVTPVHHVMVMSTETELCTTKLMCIWQVGFIQSKSVEELLPYNFMIGGDGRIYEGRGWDYLGKHPTNGYKIEDTISVAYLGTNRHKEPTQKQVKVAQMLVSEGVRLQKLTNDYNVHAVFNVKSAKILPQAATVLCENMHSEKHQCTELNGNNVKHE